MHECKRSGPFQAAIPIVLASASPRRRSLLFGLGIDVVVAPSHGREPEPRLGEPPETYARRTAWEKVHDVSRLHPDSLVIGADTVVVFDGRIIGKPRDAYDARETLRCLAGRRHEVVTVCCILPPAGLGPAEDFSVTTGVWIAAVDEAVIGAYVDGGEPMDKAGSYAIQGAGAFLVERIEGSYTNVVGLPLCELVSVLERVGAVTIRSA